MSALDSIKNFRRKFPVGPEVVSTSDKSQPAPNLTDLRGHAPIERMKGWLLQLGHTAADIDNLNIIHVAGTKGKGSTCTYVDSFLRGHAHRNGIWRKIGLYTSPILWPQNRIRIDGDQLSENIFSQRFHEVTKGLSLDSSEDAPGTRIPGFLQMMAIIAFHTFIREGVDIVICEAHHGGEYDATNFIDRPVITAITKISKDHVNNLGGSIKNIAWHKSGIFKTGAPVLTVPQILEAENEMKRRADEKNVSLRFIDVNQKLLEFVDVTASESMLFEQRENTALAIKIACLFLSTRGSSLNESDVQVGIAACRWPGRFDIVHSDDTTWFLDGAHNESSMKVVANWYERMADASARRILIFAHFSHQRTRDWSEVLGTLGASLQTPVRHSIFVREIEYDTHFTVTKERQQQYAELWQDKWPCSIYTADSVREGIDKAKEVSSALGAHILVTGSLYLAAAEAALKVLSG
ncbi:hypothetical protein N7528_004013 [Penicillium herquei]|nr:hypothetical protein N7528_004013 [Penicillium herquei]